MSFLSPDEVLFSPSSLISATGELVAPYDLENATEPLLHYRASTHDPRVKHANSTHYRLDWSSLSTVHVMNGMGVTLGDSIIGLTAIAAIKLRFPQVRFHLYRPANAPRYVEELYSLATGLVIDQCSSLPYPLSSIPAGETIVDVGNHLFWPRFADTPMIDFFLDALGVESSMIAASDKRNLWLGSLPARGLTSARDLQPYALFCPSASTPLRSIPRSVRATLVDAISRKYGMPVLGFGHVDDPAYRDITSESTSLECFLEWVRGASFVLTGDTAATHIAAGYEIPTTAFFSSIEPELRVRDYAHCFPVYLDVPSLRSLQASGRDVDLQQVERAFVTLVDAGLQLPDLPR